MENEPTDHEIARNKKRIFNGAVRKLRAAVTAGDVTPTEAADIRKEWDAFGEIDAEYLP